MVEILIRRLDEDVPLPSYAHPGDAGADLTTTVDLELAPGERAMVPTGISLALPDGYVALVHPRSGLAARCGVSIVNAPGTVDAGYRGEVKVMLINLDPAEPVRLRRGDRVAQLVVQQVERARFVEVERLPGSDRGDGGYGSTGGFASGPGREPVTPAPLPHRLRGEAVKFRRKQSDAPTGDDVETSPPTTADAEAAEAARPAEDDVRAKGPWDSTEVNLDEEDPTKVDLGGLVVTGRPGLELRLQVDEASRQVAAVLLIGPEGAVELRPFAAPRNADIWDDIRKQIAAETARAAAPPPRRTAPTARSCGCSCR